MKTSFLTIVSVLSVIVASTSAFATDENTVTSKSYVDAMDATKQDKVTAGTTGSVVTYNGTQNGQTQFSERGIFDYDTGGELDENNMYQVAEGHEGDLMTAGDYWTDINGLNAVVNDLDNGMLDINQNVNNVTNQITNINNQLNGQTLESIGVPSLTCANRDCTLYQVTTNAGIAHKLYSCTTATVATDCPACGTGTIAACVNNVCKCNACSGYNISASSASQCCSGYLISGNKCGCTSDAECVSWFAAEGMGIANGRRAVCQNDHTCGTTTVGG